ncbi:phage portal protein [Streptococcus thermophilus]|nr:phage portal protein [Streptococcus thermophilus]MCE2286142.1 phage portal protein [Streptococcus thermophilus]
MEQTLFTDSTGQDQVLNLRFHRESRIRYRADSLEELMDNSWELLKAFINHHKLRQAPRIQELLDYARGENHDVLKSGRRKDNEMADKRAVHNYGRMISKFKTGYLAGNPIRVEYDDNEDNSQNDEAIKHIGSINDIDTHNRNLIRDLSQTGRAYEVIYRSEHDETRIKRLSPLETFVIYDNSLEDNSIAAVRYYSRGSLGIAKDVVEIYTNEHIYTLDASNNFNEISVTPHAFGTVPITEFLNNVDGIGDYETELYLIDLYDSAESDTANHMSDMADAILAIYGDLALPKGMDASDMKRTRLMQLKPPKSADGKEGTIRAEYLTKSYDVSGVEAYKTRLNKDIHVFTNTPDMSDTHFSGNTSGEALKYKLFGLDQDRVDTQSQFTQGLKRRYRLAARIGSLVNEFKDFDESRLKITFTPNLPKSLYEQVSILNDLGGQVSQETALSLSGLVENPTEELDKINREVSEIDFKGYPSDFDDNVGEYTEEVKETHTDDFERVYE